MADIRPFQAYRPAKGYEDRIPALPYDVMSSAEARVIVRENPLSFLAVDRAETQFPEGCDIYSDAVYAAARDLLHRWMEDGLLVQDDAPCFYIYAQTMQGRTQTGIAALASVSDYESGIIKKHENTREEKEKDRIRHVDTCSAHTGPIFLAYRHSDGIAAVLGKHTAGERACDLLSAGDVRNRVWLIRDPEDIAAIRGAFEATGSLYIADGHHRCASAVKVAQLRRRSLPEESVSSDPECAHFLCVLFPEDELEIMDYNRVILDGGSLTEEELLERLQASFDLERSFETQARPSGKGEIGLYLKSGWYKMTLREKPEYTDPVSILDVSVLEKKVLKPVFGIEDVRTDHRIDFVGGIRGLDELERRVDGGAFCAFAMYPTSIQELFSVADAGLLMPPKSTWFEPKLLSGLFIHTF